MLSGGQGNLREVGEETSLIVLTQPAECFEPPQLGHLLKTPLEFFGRALQMLVGNLSDQLVRPYAGGVADFGGLDLVECFEILAARGVVIQDLPVRSEEHTSELKSPC